MTTVPPSDTPPAETAPDAVPTMRVVAGNPTDEELAAAHAVIMAVLAEQAARGAERLEPRADRWRRSARGRAPATSPRPPVFTKSAISGVA